MFETPKQSSCYSNSAAHGCPKWSAGNCASTEIGQFFDIVPPLTSDHYLRKIGKDDKGKTTNQIRGNTDLISPNLLNEFTLQCISSFRWWTLWNICGFNPWFSLAGSSAPKPLVSAEFLLDFPMGVRVGVDNLPEGNITIVNSHYRIWLAMYIYISQSTIVYQHYCLQSSMYIVIHLHEGLHQ
jgi:hypothetical protein